MNNENTPITTETTFTSDPGVPPTHIHVLLDRSGSMSSIRDDVIGGFNAFVAEQRAEGADARITLVQFDSTDPHDVVYEDRPIDDVPALSDTTFVPRGGTPLLDATGSLIRRARRRAKARAAAGRPESIVFVTITDGHENSSTRYSRSKVRRMVEHYRAKGWSFVYLSAGLDAFGDAREMGYDHGSVQSWDANPQGTRDAFSSLSASTLGRRRQIRTGGSTDTTGFFTVDPCTAGSDSDSDSDVDAESDDVGDAGCGVDGSFELAIRRARWAARNPGITPPSELMR